MRIKISYSKDPRFIGEKAAFFDYNMLEKQIRQDLQMRLNDATIEFEIHSKNKFLEYALFFDGDEEEDNKETKDGFWGEHNIITYLWRFDISKDCLYRKEPIDNISPLMTDNEVFPIKAEAKAFVQMFDEKTSIMICENCMQKGKIYSNGQNDVFCAHNIPHITLNFRFSTSKEFERSKNGEV